MQFSVLIDHTGWMPISAALKPSLSNTSVEINTALHRVPWNSTDMCMYRRLQNCPDENCCAISQKWMSGLLPNLPRLFVRIGCI